MVFTFSIYLSLRASVFNIKVVYEITSITIFDISAIVCRLYNKGRKSKNSLERTDYSGINRFAIGKADK